MGEGLWHLFKSGKPCFGIYVSFPDPSMIEMIALAGYDFIRIDAQHTLFSLSEIRCLIEAANAHGLPVFVRVSDLSQADAILDAGADGLLVPGINSVSEARVAVDKVKYAPLGHRGLSGFGRFNQFGQIDLKTSTEQANKNILLGIQIESREGLENLDDILSVDGIDIISSGKNDLSQALGLEAGQSSHPSVLAAENDIITKTIDHQKIPIMLVGSLERQKTLLEKGVSAFMIGRDTSIYFRALQANIQKYV